MAIMIPRKVRAQVLEALGDTPIVLVMGARQVGKSTLTRDIAANEDPRRILSLDNTTVREAAARDPTGFVADIDGPVLIDEVQRVPDLILEMKDSLEEDRTAGRYLLTGSSNLLRSRKIQEALTGRIDIVELWPLAQSEIEESSGNFVDALFAAKPPVLSGQPKRIAAYAGRVAGGGYPEALGRSGRRRDAWFRNYVKTTLEKDLPDLAAIQKSEEMPRLLSLLAGRTGNLISWSAISNNLAIDEKTVKAYASLLEGVFLIKRVPAWTRGFLGRVRHAPKIYVRDTALLLHLLGADESRVGADQRITGMAFENFVGTEICKLATWADNQHRLFHFRDAHDGEVDIVLEHLDGRVAAVEVKAAAAVSLSRDGKGLVKLRDKAKNHFVAGVIIYTGAETVRLDDRIWAVPVSALWSQEPPAQ